MGREEAQRGVCEVKHRELLHEFGRLDIPLHEGMNLLTELCLISDNCVYSDDIANEDAEFATDILKTFMTATIPTYTTEQLREAEAKSDEVKEELEITQAMGGETRELESKFSKAHKLVRFMKRRLEDQAA